MRKFFGTDGIRGVANEYPLIPSLVIRVGQAIALALDPEKRGIAVGKDSRLSGDMIESALIAGLTSCGSPVYPLGIMPTPGIAYLTKKMQAAAGVVISASHNPMEDNGLKIFGPDGFKLTDQKELELEQLIGHEKQGFPHPTGSFVGRLLLVQKADQQYLDFLKILFIDLDLTGLSIVLDCANGATSAIAPFLFQELGAQVYPINYQPNGLNINHLCGAMHPEVLAKEVQLKQADVGFCFDGDGDRVLCVDEQGTILTGDNILLILALDLMAQQKLPHNLLVTTVMSNLGLLKAAEQAGLGVKQTQVGDRYVLEQMLNSEAILGGEDSGHVILLDGDHTTGDGIFIALQMLRIIAKQKKAVSTLGKLLQRYPQVLKAVPVKKRVDLNDLPEVQAVITEGRQELQDQGRILVRYSGTQLMVRIMVEGPQSQVIEEIATRISEVVKQQLAEV